MSIFLGKRLVKIIPESVNHSLSASFSEKKFLVTEAKVDLPSYS